MATINLKTLLSTFNEKGTLLKWLQQLEKALAQSVLESVTVTTSTAGSAVFSFNFADDTAIETPPVPLPRGEAGLDGTSIKTITEGEPLVQDNFTITPFIITLTDGTTIPLEVSAANGAAAAAGRDGVGIEEITSGEPYESNGDTVTPITITKTEGEPIELSISAKNGTNGTNGTNGNGIVTVHALRHYMQDTETITVVEAVTDNGENPQFEVHARNGSNELYYHEVSLNLNSDSYFIKIGFYNQYNVQFTVQGILDLFKYGTLPILEYMDDVGEYGITTGLSILETGVAFRIFTGFNTVSFIQINNISDISIDDYIIKKL